ARLSYRAASSFLYPSFKGLPARIRRESTAEFLRKRPQCRDDTLDTARARVVQRTAAEWSITRAKNHRAVAGVGVINNSFAQSCDADIRHRQDQPIDHLVGRLLLPGRPLRLVGLAVLPIVKASAALPPEFALGDFFAQPGWCLREQIA